MIESIVLKNTVTGVQININRDKGEYWLNEFDPGQVESSIHTFKFIDQIGETVYNTTLSPRQLSISGWVAGWNPDTVHKQKLVLNSFVNPKHLINLYANEKRIQFYPRASVAYSPTYQKNNEYISEFLITGYCPYPLFTDKNEHSVSIAYTEKKFKFPLIIPKEKGIIMGIRQPSLIGEIEYDGDLPIGYVIEFRAFGKVVNPILTDIGSQQFIEINKTMTAGEAITIDTREGSRHIVGSINNIESNYYKYRNFDSSWLSLKQGINYLRYNAEEGITSLEVVIKFEPGYLEVDS